jgi:oligopeptide transport system substrate-binding protein
MKGKKWVVLFAALVITGLIASACAAPTAQTIETIVTQVVKEEIEVVTTEVVPVIKEVEKIVEVTPVPAAEAAGAKTLRLNMGPGDITTIDPALGQDTSGTQIIDLTTIGLTYQNEETAEVEPGMATEWSISNDGLVYTFKIREGVPWVKYDAPSGQVVKVQDCEGNDRTVTAQDFEYGILRALNPETASDYAYVLSFALAGADAYNTGAVTDTATVGVKAIDPTTLEITFKEPAAYNANIIGLWVAHAQPNWIIEGDDCTEARGERWTETGFFQGYGPYTLKEWIHDASITLVKNPFWPGTDNVSQAKIDEVTWLMLDEVPAFAEYEAGNLDVATVPQSDIQRVKTDPTLSQELKIAPTLCSYYYGFNTTGEFVDDVRVRRALSYAIDRAGLVEFVTQGGQEPAQWFSRPGLSAAPTMASHPDLGAKHDPEKAKAELQSYLDEKGLTPAELDITLMFNTSSGHQKIAEAIQQMWKDTLGIEVKLANQESKVYWDTVTAAESPQVFRMGWCQDYPDANNFIREVFAVGGNVNPNPGGVNWENAEFEALVRQAAQELDPAKRVELYALAEEILNVEDAVIAPIYWYTIVTVTKPHVDRTFSVLGGLERIQKWDITGE